MARRLTGLIVDGQLQEGELLPKEEAMMHELGVSRTALREGLRILETYGLIETRPGRNGGIIVKQPSFDVLIRPMLILFQREQISLAAIIDAREMIECLCVRQAATQATDKDIGRIEDALNSGDQYMLGSKFWQHTLDFHDAVAQASHNPVLTLLLLSLREIVYHCVKVPNLNAEDCGKVIATHKRILEAIREKDPDAAERRMRRHLTAVRSHLGGLLASDLSLVPVSTRYLSDL